MNPDQPGSLEEQVVELRSRVHRLEETLRVRGVPLYEAPPPRPAAAPVNAAPSPARPTPPLFAHSAAPATPQPSLETRVASQWFNRVGILAILIAAAWFLKLAIDNHWIGAQGRILIGLAAGAGLIAWSERFRTRGFSAFSYSLKATGSGILYLSLWAAFSFFHLIPAGAAFAAMVAVTAFNGLMSWVQDSELLALYAIVGGLSTPLLVSTGENHEITLFSYLLLLDLAVLVLVALRPWSRLLFAAFLGTVLMFTGWWFSFYSDSQSLRTSVFLAIFFLVFAFAPRLVERRLPGDDAISAWDTLSLVLLPIAAAALGFLGFYAIVETASADWAAPWIAVTFAAFYLVLLRLPAAGRLRSAPGLLSSLHLTAAVVFLTLAIPLKAHGRWLTIGWLAEAAALFWIAARLRSALLRILALICLAIGLVALLTVNPDASTIPLFNERFGAYAFAIAVLGFITWVATHASPEDHPDFSPRWQALAAAALLAVNALILLAVSLEIHAYWWNLRWTGYARPHHDLRMYAQFTYSAWFMLFGAALLAVGFSRRSAFLRWQALVLLALAIGKVFLVDVGELSQAYRILSFLGLGALLLGVSFVYQRDWLNLRGENPDGQSA